MRYHSWLKYGNHGHEVEIIIRDDNGSKLEGFRFSAKDKKTWKKILKTIKAKYGIDLYVKSSNSQEDLDWLK